MTATAKEFSGADEDYESGRPWMTDRWVMAWPAERTSRRQFLTGGAAFVGGATVGAIARCRLRVRRHRAVTSTTPGEGTPFPSGAASAGVETPAPALCTLIALDLRESVDREDVGRLLRLWTDDAARLMAGDAALADMEPELAARPCRLTVTMGLGPSFFGRLGLETERHRDLVEVPALADRPAAGALVGGRPAPPGRRRRCGDAGPRDATASARWSRLCQRALGSAGFPRDAGSTEPGTTPRNLFGQVDGTVNPEPGTEDFAQRGLGD